MILVIWSASLDASLTPMMLSISASLNVVSSVMFNDVREGTLYSRPGRPVASAMALKCR